MLDLAPLLVAVVAGGALLGGLASGLAGFAFAATTLGIYTHVVPPALISPLIVGTSLAVQLQVMPMLWRRLDWRTALPFVLGGIVGVPLGVLLLSRMSPDAFRLFAGIVLIVYATTTLVAGRLPTMRVDHRGVDAVIGWTGGVLGGFAGLSGVVPTIWCSMRRWSKDRQRSVFQLFNTAMHISTLVGYASAGRLSVEVGQLILVALPAAWLGGWIGFRIYRKIDDRAFARVLLVLLGLSGVTMVAPHLVG
jgi:uncharacterized membrane protein YfcA